MPRNDHFQDVTVAGNVSLGAQSKVEGNLVPDTDDDRDLGSSSQRWANLYLASTLNATGFRADSITLDTTNADVVLSRASANKLQLASGDSFQLETISAVGNINNTLFIDGVKYAKTAAGIASAYSDLPSTGGVIDARGMEGTFTFTSSVTLGSATKPVTLLLGAVAITFTGTNGFVFNGRSCQLIGVGPLATNLLAGSGFTGSLVLAEPASGANSIDGFHISGVRFDGSAAPSATLLSLLSVRDPSSVRNIQFRDFLGKAMDVGVSSVPGAAISEGISIQDIYSETRAGTKTADTFTIQANVVHFRNATIASATIEGTKRAVVFKGSSNGDGRGNTFIGGQIGGYTKPIAIEGTRPTGNVISGVWFEDFNDAISVNGEVGNKAEINTIHGNYYLVGSGTGATFVTFDYANGNTLIENQAGGVGRTVLTANSTANNIVIRYSTGVTDVSDAGVGNVIHGFLDSGGTGRHVLQGEVQILRNQTGASQWTFNDSGNLLAASAGQDICSTGTRCDFFGAIVDGTTGTFAAVGSVTPGTGAFTTLTGTTLNTTTNCASSGGTCGSAASGSVSIAAAATTVTVATTAVTANSVILITEDSSLGTKLGVTCNTVIGRNATVTARTAATSFVVTVDVAPVTNPMCLSYMIVN